MEVKTPLSPTDPQQELASLKDIRMMMERSSRFISLSGLSGIAAGLCALTGAWMVSTEINCLKIGDCLFQRLVMEGGVLEKKLTLIAGGTFISAFTLAFLFTWLRSKKNNVRLGGTVARRLMWNVAVPIITGAIFLFAMIRLKQYELIAPGCLVFYGLALVNASKYTLNEIRYMGYSEIILGLISCFYIGYGLHFWAVGFGLLHIIYGSIMWWRYERKS